MNAILKDRPLDGQQQSVGADERVFQTRAGMSQRVAYHNTGEIDLVTGLRVFAFRPSSPDQDGKTADNSQENDADDK